LAAVVQPLVLAAILFSARLHLAAAAAVVVVCPLRLPDKQVVPLMVMAAVAAAELNTIRQRQPLLLTLAMVDSETLADCMAHPEAEPQSVAAAVVVLKLLATLQAHLTAAQAKHHP